MKFYYRTFLAFFVFAAVSLNGKSLRDFGPKERELIVEFRSIAVGEKNKRGDFIDQEEVKKSLQFIEQIKQRIERKELDPGFEIFDLFTTYYRDRFAGYYEQSLLTEYCLHPLYDLTFYETLLGYVKHHIDSFRNSEGQTILMQLASYGSDRATPCAAELLDRGERLNLRRWKKGLPHYDALTDALLNNSTGNINLFIDTIGTRLKNNPIRLDWTSQELLWVYQGKVFSSRAVWGQHIPNLYRVANQSLNYGMVDKLFPSLKVSIKRNLEKWEETNANKRGSFYYPPFWLYNASQLKTYAEELVKRLEKNVIDKSKLTKRPDGLYEYLDDGKKLVLMKKTAAPLVGRILGRNHLEKAIERSGLKNKYAVPKKFLIPPEGGLNKAKVVFRFPHAPKNSEEGLMPFFSVTGLNQVGVEVEGVELYVEYIEGKFIRLGSHSMLSWFGFIDGDKGNAIKSEKDGLIYIIDTGDDKNFIVPLGTNTSGGSYKAKSLQYAPHIPGITISLDKGALLD